MSFINKKFKDFSLIETTNESTLTVGKNHLVNSVSEIPQSMINQYCKNVMEKTGKNLREFYSETKIAELLVDNVIKSNLDDVTKLSPYLLLGGDEAQAAQAQGQSQEQPQSQIQAQTPTNNQVEPQAQSQSQVQPQAQTQGQSQAQSQDSSEFENVQGDDNDESQSQKDSETLPLD